MASYETMYIIHPELAPEAVTTLNDKFKGILTKNDANIFNFEEWGMKKLAYKVRKQTKGYFCILNYDGPAQSIDEVERALKLNEQVMKFLSVVLTADGRARIEKKIAARKKAKIMAAETAAKAAEAAAAAPEPEPAPVVEKPAPAVEEVATEPVAEPAKVEAKVEEVPATEEAPAAEEAPAEEAPAEEAPAEEAPAEEAAAEEAAAEEAPAEEAPAEEATAEEAPAEAAAAEEAPAEEEAKKE